MAELKQVTIYTDGACLGNPGPGGYGAVLLHGEKRLELSGGFRLTTNNRMELLGVIAGLRALRYPCDVTVHSDSTYVVNGFNRGWVHRWKASGWMRAGAPIPNADLWQGLLALCDHHKVTFVWVRGHAGNPENECCDRLSVQAAKAKDLPADPGFAGHGGKNEARAELGAPADAPPTARSGKLGPPSNTQRSSALPPAAQREATAKPPAAKPAAQREAAPKPPAAKPAAQREATAKPPAAKPAAQTEAAPKPPAAKPAAQREATAKPPAAKPAAQREAAPKPPAAKPAAQREATAKPPAAKPAAQREATAKPPAAKPAAQTEAAPKPSPRGRITAAGQPCGHCGAAVERRTPQAKRKPGQTFYYAYYLACPNCNTLYMVDEARRSIEPGEL